MMYVDFSNPILLLVLLAVPIFCWLYMVSARKRMKSALKFSSLSFTKSSVKTSGLRRHAFFIFTALAFTLLITAMADPHIPLETAREGVSVVLAIDTSGSMQATDYQPTRLEAAKAAAKILLLDLQPKDSAGVVIFESGATTAAYLSPFKKNVISRMESIQPKQGSTAMGDGLALAVDMVASIPNRQKVVILLSDGVNNAGTISPDEATTFAKNSGIQINTVGMGSDKPVVLGYDMFGNPQYAELDEAGLRKIASETGGKYYKSIDSGTLSEIYGAISSNIKREKEPVSVKDWFIAAALVVLAAESYVVLWKYRVVV